MFSSAVFWIVLNDMFGDIFLMFCFILLYIYIYISKYFTCFYLAKQQLVLPSTEEAT